MISLTLWIILNTFTQDTLKLAKLEGRVIDVATLYPLSDDSHLDKTPYPVIRPLLVLNGIPIRDSVILNFFRNKRSKKILYSSRLISQNEGTMLGFTDVPLDGVLFINTLCNSISISIHQISQSESEHLGKKYGLALDYFDFNQKSIYLLISDRTPACNRQIRRIINNNSPITGNDGSLLFIPNDDMKESGYDAIIWYKSE